MLQSLQVPFEFEFYYSWKQTQIKFRFMSNMYIIYILFLCEMGKNNWIEEQDIFVKKI